MSIYAAMTEAIINELKYGGFMVKQKSVTKLFPKFGDRVNAVDANGGITLVNKTPDLWTFAVASGTKPGVKYTVYLYFKDLPEMINKWASDNRLWDKEQKQINYNELAAEIFNDANLESDCNCPADLYWGPEYIKTQYKNRPGGKAQYDHEEDRAPKIRNPKKYGIVCKHAYNVFKRLPFYTQTFANFLKQYWAKDIQKVVDRAREEQAKFKKVATELGKREVPQLEPKPEVFGRKSLKIGAEEEKPEVKGKKKEKEVVKGKEETGPTATKPATKPITPPKNKKEEEDKKKGKTNPEGPKEK